MRELNLYKDFFYKSIEAMFIIEGNKFIDCNKTALEILQYEKKKELLNCHPADISPEKQSDGQLSFDKANKIIDFVNKNGYKRFEWEHKKKDGTIFPVEISLTSIKKGDTKILHSIWRDISERKKAEENLKRSNQKCQTTFDSIDDSICLIDIEGKIIQYNSATKNFSKIKEENFIGMTCCDAFCVTEEHKSKCPFKRMKKSKKVEAALDLIDNKWIFVHVYPIFDEKGNLVQAVHTTKDYTSQKRSEDILLKTSRIEATTTLAAGVAHDFNNLMVGVLGNAELIKMKYKIENPVEKMLDNIINSALKAGDLSKQLLAFAKGGKYDPKPIDLNDVIQETLNLNKISVPQRIKIEKNIEPNLWNVMADPIQMNQALMNLCINSVESINKKGKIVISSKNVQVDEAYAKQYSELKEGNYVYISIEDTGSGMDKETIKKVFEPFFSTKFLGRGLGLATVFRIVKNHEGRITVYSEPNKGTSFKIYLPALNTEKIIKKKEKIEVDLGSETILIIDDDQIVLDVTKHILEALGFNILIAHNGQEAIDYCKQYKNKIHIALLDIGMPVLGGTEVFPLIKKYKPDLKIIICSGYELNDETQKLLDAGANAFLQKPFKAGSLMMNIKKVLESDNVA